MAEHQSPYTGAQIDAAVRKVSDLESIVGNDGTVDSRIDTAKSELRGNATTACDTLGDAEALIGNLQQAYNNLQQSKPIPVSTLPTSDQQQGVIYRLAGTTSYSDYMWNGSSWVCMATYNNAIDDVPAAGSGNLVKSEGVKLALLGLVGVNSPTELIDRSSLLIDKSLLNNTGAERSDPGYCLTPFIRIDPTDHFFVHSYQNRIYLYDENKESGFLGFINPHYQGFSLVSYSSSYRNAVYARLYIATAEIEQIRLAIVENENPLIGYFDYIKEVLNIGFVQKKPNGELFDASTVTLNKTINPVTGLERDDTGYFYSALIPIDKSKRIYLNTRYNRIHCFDTNLVYLDRTTIENGASIESLGGKFANTAYVIVENSIEQLKNTSIRYTYDKGVYNEIDGYTNKKAAKLRVGTYNVGDFTGSGFDAGSMAARQAHIKVIGKSKTDILSVQTDIAHFPSLSNGIELFDPSKTTSDTSLYNDTGIPHTDIGWFVSDFIRVDPFAIIQNNSYQSRVYCYDESKSNFIGWGWVNGKAVSSLGNAYMNTAYIRIEGTTENLASTSVKSFTDPIFSNAFSKYYIYGSANYNYKGIASDRKIDITAVYYTGGTFDHPYFLAGTCNIEGKTVLFSSFHFDWSDKTRRRQQIAQMIAYASDYEYCVLAGDTNCENYENGTKINDDVLYAEEWAIFAEAGYTMANNGDFGLMSTYHYPTESGGEPLDNIFVRGMSIGNVELLKESWMLDHYMLVADVVIP